MIFVRVPNGNGSMFVVPLHSRSRRKRWMWINLLPTLFVAVERSEYASGLTPTLASHA